MSEREVFMVALVVFFFFQAEDGIRDVAVTGVQTCALPIYVCQTYCRRGSYRSFGPGRLLVVARRLQSPDGSRVHLWAPYAGPLYLEDAGAWTEQPVEELQIGRAHV